MTRKPRKYLPLYKPFPDKKKIKMESEQKVISNTLLNLIFAIRNSNRCMTLLYTFIRDDTRVLAFIGLGSKTFLISLQHHLLVSGIV